MASHCKSYRQFKPWKCVVHQPTRFYRSTCLNQLPLFEGTQGQPICEPWGAQVDAEFEEQLAADIDELRAVSRAKAMVGCCVTDDLRIHLMDSNGLSIKSVYSLCALSDSSFSAISDLILRALNPQSLCVFNIYIYTWLCFFLRQVLELFLGSWFYAAMREKSVFFFL